MNRKRKQLEQVPAVATRGDSFSVDSVPLVPDVAQIDDDVVGHEDLEFRELKATHDTFNATRQQLTDQIDACKR